MARCGALHRPPEYRPLQSRAEGHAGPALVGHNPPHRQHVLRSRPLERGCFLQLQRGARGFAVRLRSLVDAWNEFFFAPQSPVPIGLFRAFYGTVVFAPIILLRPRWLPWYGPHAWMSLSALHKLEPGIRLDLFEILPQTNGWIEALFWVFLGSAVLLAVGLFTRINSVIVFVCLASIHQRNLYINNGGDTFLRVA